MTSSCSRHTDYYGHVLLKWTFLFLITPCVPHYNVHQELMKEKYLYFLDYKCEQAFLYYILASNLFNFQF